MSASVYAVCLFKFKWMVVKFNCIINHLEMRCYYQAFVKVIILLSYNPPLL